MKQPRDNERNWRQRRRNRWQKQKYKSKRQRDTEDKVKWIGGFKKCMCLHLAEGQIFPSRETTLGENRAGALTPRSPEKKTLPRPWKTKVEEKEAVAMPRGWALSTPWCHLTAATYSAASHTNTHTGTNTHTHTHTHSADVFTCAPFYSWALSWRPLG